MNIPSAIMQMVGGGNIASSISSILGLNQDQTKRATSAAIPSLLAGLAGLASTPQGAERLAETVSRQDTGLVDNLAGAFSGQGSRLADQGSGLLGSLLGGGATAKLGSVLSRFTGLGEGSTGKLLGMLTPIILSFLGKQQRAMGLNAGGLANLLTGQRDNLRASMPAGLETVLSSVLPGGSQMFGSTGARIAEPRHTYEETTTRVEETADWRSREVYAEPVHRGGGGKKWVAALLLALGALAAFLFWSSRDKSRRVEPVGAPVTVSGTITGTVDRGIVDRATSATSSFVSDASRLIGQAGTTLAGIKDSATAETAAPRLQQINQQLNGLRSTWGQLPESTKSTAASVLQSQIARLKQSAQSLLTQPGVGETIRPHVDELMQNLSSFSGQTQTP